MAALAAIGSVVATYYYTKRREHEAEWRKLRLDRYQEFLRALSVVVRPGYSYDDREKYADAVNNLTLVAPRDVLNALYRYQDAVSRLSEDIPQEETAMAVSDLVNAMRNDVQPGFAKGG